MGGKSRKLAQELSCLREPKLPSRTLRTRSTAKKRSLSHQLLQSAKFEKEGVLHFFKTLLRTLNNEVNSTYQMSYTMPSNVDWTNMWQTSWCIIKRSKFVSVHQKWCELLKWRLKDRKTRSYSRSYSSVVLKKEYWLPWKVAFNVKHSLMRLRAIV